MNKNHVKLQNIFGILKNNPTFALPIRNDSLAQLVEHNTFNVGVLGSSPRRVTRTDSKMQVLLSVFVYS